MLLRSTSWLLLAEMAGGSEDGRTILNSLLGERLGVGRRRPIAAHAARRWSTTGHVARLSPCLIRMSRSVRPATAEAHQGIQSV